MAIDRREDDDIPIAATGSGEVDADSAGADKIIAGDAGGSEDSLVARSELPEERERHKYHLQYRDAVDAVYESAARQRWEAAKPGFAQEQRRYADEHPASPDVRPGVDEGTRAQVEQGCKEIRETEENIVTPAMARIEAEDPGRRLVGLEFRCKGQDRIMEKVANWMAAQSDLSPGEALAMVKDPIRYTFQYSKGHYTEGVYADVERLKTAGFELVELRNSWGSEEYKGINSRWRVPGNRQLFEVQFHTEISFEAKQLTHPAYERLRSTSTSEAEQSELVNFQRRVNGYVPEPQRVREISNFP